MKNKYNIILGVGLLTSVSLIGYPLYKGSENKITNVDKFIFGAGLLSLATTYSYGIGKNPALMEMEKQNKLEKELKE